MRIVFMGSPAEVIAPLQILQSWCAASTRHQLVGVVSQPPRPFGRKRKLQDPPLAQYAKEQGLSVLQPEKAGSPEFLEELKAWQPDIVITAAYGQILTSNFLKIPSRATINIHPSLLPAYRGATPVQSALLDEQSITGVSILFTVKELDAGAIILQEESSIAADERAGELTARLFKLGGKMLPKAIQALEDLNFVGIEQDPKRVTHSFKIQKDDGKIDWQQSARQIYARYRAYHPWPGTFTFFQDRRIVLEELALAPKDIPPPQDELPVGGFLYHKPWNALAIKTQAGFLRCYSLKPQGSNTQDALAFINRLKGEKRGIFQ